MELTTGYKKTHVGVLPTDWDCVTLRAAAASRANAIVGGPFGSDLVSADYVEQGVPVIRGQNMGAATIRGPFAFVTNDKARALSANLAFPGDLVFTQRGTLGQVSVIPGKSFECYLVSQSQMKITLNINRHDPAFLLQYFVSYEGQRQILSSAIQTGVPHTNLGILRRYQFPAPPLSEQQTIAEALGDVDGLLDRVDRLIAKKRDLKQAATQQLLSGQSRLPGFTAEWRASKIGNVAEIDPENLESTTPKDFRFNYISLEDVERGVLKSHSEQVFGTAPSRARRKLRDDDILFGTVRPNLKSHLLFQDDGRQWICSTGFCVVRCRDNLSHPAYIFFKLFSYSVERQIDALLVGSNYPAINGRDVAGLEIAVPDFNEQIAIAEVLTDIEAEIATLEAQRDKTHALKRAMMQELLTGKTRLAASEATSHA